MWRHKWRPIVFTLIVDKFGVKYKGKCHKDHLLNAIKEHYYVTFNKKGNLYAGINRKWDYDKHTFRLTMEDCIAKLRAKFDHPTPKKLQPSPHRLTAINYGSKFEYATETTVSPPLNEDGKLCIQQLIGAIR